MAESRSANGQDFAENDSGRESSANGFTAVNGRISPEQHSKTHSSSDKRRRTDNPNGAESNSHPQQAKERTRQSDSTSESQSISPTESRPEYMNSSPKKRKRADSDESDESNSPKYKGYQDARQYREPSDSGLGRDSPDSPRNGSRYGDEQIPTSAVQSHPDYRPPELSNYRSIEGDANYGQPNQPSPQSEAHLAEALQRENQGHPQQHIQFQPGMPLANGVQTAPPKSRTGPERPPVIQIDKKRKRVFSNRTKTGCLTCRSRKKKCDETKPACDNCVRGGFHCAGYATKPTYAKPPFTNKPVPLQSKDGYPEQSGVQQAPPPQAHYRDSAPQQMVEGQRTRPIMVEEERDHHNSRASWPAQPWSDQNQQQAPPYYTDNIPRDGYPPAPAMPETPRDHQPPQHRDYGPPPMSRPMSHGTSSQQAVTAQLALQHTATNGPPPPPAPQTRPHRSEKDKMLAAEPHLPFCTQLVEEREMCKSALWRFNNSTNPNVGVSREERARLFRAIVEPAYLRTQGPPGPANPIGSVGREVCVEAPFNCDYGYNINIGDYTVIGANCTIMDPCTITIGPGCTIGPNVSIFGMSMPIDPRRRNGSRGHAVGSRVTIGENCYIGGGAIILPKVTIGKNSTVGAGSVVTRDVRDNTVVAGNPAHFQRYA
ncbi:MAG: Maltose acetyltransferase [Bathelium mastoideum]|nr:MAG: Maltose acetyltransferase [Bathelium mastoideum]